MIDINLQYQAVLFGSYEDISPKPETLKYFIEAFADKELIPTTFQELGSNGAVNRFSLMSNDNMWVIDFSINRINIKKTNKDIGVTNIGLLKQFTSEAFEIAKVIEDLFPKKHNRLSLITRYLLPEMDANTMSIIYLNLNKTIEEYQNNVITDWNNKTTSRISYTMGKTSELFNIISEVKRTIGNHKFNSKLEKIDRVELSFDLNTYQGNTDYRFDLVSFKLFLDLIYGIETTLKDKYLTLIGI